jgi:TctA family transporter
MIFLERPISALLLVALVASLVWPVVAAIRRHRGAVT